MTLRLRRSGSLAPGTSTLLLCLALAACARDEHGDGAVPASATAAVSIPRGPLYAEDGNAAAGATLAAQGAPAQQLPPCSACHGRHGEGSAVAGFPRLAGQPPDYLQHQLEAFANGERHDPAMTPIARQLTAAQRRDVAAYYGGRRAPALLGPDTPAAPQRGQTLAIHGDAALGVPACGNCHGWNGAGNSPDVPYLAGQHLRYLEESLHTWRDGSRDSDHRRQMPEIARRLQPEDVLALAEYFASLPPPRPMHHEGAAPLAAAGHPALPVH